MSFPQGKGEKERSSQGTGEKAKGRTLEQLLELALVGSWVRVHGHLPPRQVHEGVEGLHADRSTDSEIIRKAILARSPLCLSHMPPCKEQRTLRLAHLKRSL